MPVKSQEISPKVGLTAETSRGQKMIVNPYYGCSHNCLFCPANDGYLRKKIFDECRASGKVYVVSNILDHVRSFRESNSSNIIAHLSPVSDPFQPLEREYGKTEEVVRFCASQSIPVAICTKGIIPEHLYDIIAGHRNSFVQLSIPSTDELVRSYLVRGDGATVEEMFAQIRKLIAGNVALIVRIDPVFPFINDDLAVIKRDVETYRDLGVKYILSSCADLYYGALEREADYLDRFSTGLSEKYRELYVEDINGRLHACLDYRERLFGGLSEICKSVGVAFGITWEPDRDGSSLAPRFNHGAPAFLSAIGDI